VRKEKYEHWYYKNSIKVSKKILDFKETAVFSSKEFAGIISGQLLGKWIILFSYFLDFTFLCPTEIIAFDKAHKSFNIGAEIIKISIDSIYLNLA
jgi:alkyl hydroperoxide reductase subunit AhpC